MSDTEETARKQRLSKLLPLLQQWYYVSDGWSFKAWKWEDNNLIAVSDCYYDPILSLCKLNKEDVIRAEFKYAGEELDKVVITDVRLELFKAIDHKDSNYSNIESRIAAAKKDYKGEDYFMALRPMEKPSAIMILGGKTIATAKWDAYWKKRGKHGPDSGWEIPTIEDIERDLGY